MLGTESKKPGQWAACPPQQRSGPGHGQVLVWLVVMLLITSCPSPKPEEELRQEIQALKTEVMTLKEKVAQLEASQQQLAARLLPTPRTPEPSQPLAAAAELPGPLSVGQLLKERERFLGARVIVRGEPGPVLMHRKSLLLKSPQGMVEVFFGNLPDKKQRDRLTSQTLTGPLTVTGLVQPPSGQDLATLQIIAEVVEF